MVIKKHEEKGRKVVGSVGKVVLTSFFGSVGAVSAAAEKIAKKAAEVKTERKKLKEGREIASIQAEFVHNNWDKMPEEVREDILLKLKSIK